MAQAVKHLPAIQETWFQSLGREDALEKEMATHSSTLARKITWTGNPGWLQMAPHSSTLAWKIPWMEEPGGLQSMGSQRVGHDWETSLSFFSLFFFWIVPDLSCSLRDPVLWPWIEFQPPVLGAQSLGSSNTREVPELNLLHVLSPLIFTVMWEQIILFSS